MAVVPQRVKGTREHDFTERQDIWNARIQENCDGVGYQA